MENISELIQKNKESFHKDINQEVILDQPVRNVLKGIDILNTQSLKSLIDAVIEDEEKEIRNYKENWENQTDLDKSIALIKIEAKQDTISKLQAIKELL